MKITNPLTQVVKTIVPLPHFHRPIYGIWERNKN